MGAEVLISVLMGTYNEPRQWVKNAIDSVLNQTFWQFEFIICDDGSDNAFFQWLMKYCKIDGRICLLRNKKNHGLAYTLNRCLAHAHGKYVARMDADDISLPRRFERQMAFLEQHPEYAFTGCNIFLMSKKGIWGKRVLERKPGERSFLKTSPFVHPVVMVRKNVLDELKGYSTDRHVLRVEDYELFMRMYAAGYCGYNIQEFLFCYREDRNAYQKRKYCYRIHECQVRFWGFQSIGILKGNLRYVIKPLVAGLIPAKIMSIVKYKRYK